MVAFLALIELIIVTVLINTIIVTNKAKQKNTQISEAPQVASSPSPTPISTPIRTPESKPIPNLQFHFRRKSFVMTKVENHFFDFLIGVTAGKYYVFPQVHLSSIFEHKLPGQNWNYAFNYLNPKSIDYLICDIAYRRPVLGIELDDWTHDTTERRQRDVNVESIFQEAGIPLLRFRHIPTEQELKQKLDEALGLQVELSQEHEYISAA